MAAKCKCENNPEQIRDRMIKILHDYVQSDPQDRYGWLGRRRMRWMLAGVMIAIGIIKLAPLMDSESCKHEVVRSLDCDICSVLTGEPCTETICADCGESIE